MENQELISLKDLKLGSVYRCTDNEGRFRVIHDFDKDDDVRGDVSDDNDNDTDDHHVNIEFQKFSCGCWNECSDMMNTTETFISDPNFDEESFISDPNFDKESYRGEGITAKDDPLDFLNPLGSKKEKEVKEEPHLKSIEGGAKILNFNKDANKFEELVLPPLKKFDFKTNTGNVYLETRWLEDSVLLSYKQMVSFSNAPFIDQQMRDYLEGMAEKVEADLSNVYVQLQHLTREVKLNWFENFMNWLMKEPFMTLDEKAYNTMTFFQDDQAYLLERGMDITTMATRLNERIKAK